MGEPALSLAGVSVAIHGRTLLGDVSFVAAPGTITAVIGPNGAGKSTLAKALAGLLPAHGEIRLAGVALKRLAAAERARSVAYVPQFSLLDAPIEVRSVVAQGRYVYGRGLGALHHEDNDAIDAAMTAADITELGPRLFTELSYGERRRVLIARALATAAPLVVLDEPTASLDLAHALAFLTLLRRLAAAGRCIVAVLHDFDQALAIADNAVVLSRGRLVLQGPTREVFAAPSLGEVFGVELVAGGGLGYRLLHGGNS